MLNPLRKMLKKHYHNHHHDCGCHKCKCQANAHNYKDCDFSTNIPLGTITLNNLNPGDKATIVSLLGCSRFHSRLQEMGFVAGKQIQVIRFAPIGDPMEIDILGTKLSLRKAEATSILVTRINPL